jgi:hypothetical protein
LFQMSPHPAARTAYTLTISAEGSSSTVTFNFKDTDMSLVSQSNPEYPGVLSYETGSGTPYYKLLLDSLTPGKQFKNLFAAAGFVPGVDLTVSVKAYSTKDSGILPSYASTKVNSLFASRTGGSVAVAWGRHLQNLSPAFSGTVSTVTEAVQIKDITWNSSFLFVPITNSNLSLYNGNENVIDGLKILDNSAGAYLGMFASFSGTLKNIRLSGVSITGSSAAGAGALAGRALNAIISNCQVYAVSNFAASSITAAGYTGGLVGRAEACTITDSSASLPAISSVGGTAGGLIGLMSGGSLERCYAGTGYRPSGDAWSGGITSSNTSGGLVGRIESGTVSSCYSLGYLNTALSAGFMTVGTGTVTVSNSYSAAVFGTAAVSSYGFSNGGSLTGCSYWEGSGASLGDTSIKKTWEELHNLFTLNGNPWFRSSTLTTSPYGISGAYPFPQLISLKHYGDWPDKPVSAVMTTGVVYFERYQDGSYGFYHADGSSTLKGNDYTIVETGYGVLFNQNEDISRYLAGPSAEALDTYPNDYYPNPFINTPLVFSNGSVLYSFNTETITKMINNTHNGRYGTLSVGFADITYSDGKIKCSNPTLYNINPRFAAALSSYTAAVNPGSAERPFQIRTQTQLDNLRYQAGNGSSWKQTHNISVSGWSSITPLTWVGSLIDGDNNIIDGLTQPLFMTINEGVTVKNLHIKNADITLSGTDKYGILANTNRGSIQNCKVEASRIRAANGNTAGFVGTNHNAASISGCYLSAEVSGLEAAGFAVSVNGTITNCIAANSKISALSGRAAGFVLHNDWGGNISNCYANAEVYGNDAAGFAAVSYTSINNCYALISVTAAQRAAGFMLDGTYNISITNCYSAFSRITGAAAYGFSPSPNNMYVISNCYFLSQAGLTGGGGQGVTYQQLSDLILGSGWEKASVSRTHPNSPALYGQAYPFPLLSALDHYGDWPVDDMGNVYMVYYEVYNSAGKDKIVAFFNPEIGLSSNMLRNDLPVLRSGFALLFKEDSNNNNASGGINFPNLTSPGAITLTWPDGSGGSTTANGLITASNLTDFNGNDLSISYNNVKLTNNSAFSLSVPGLSGNFLPLFIPDYITANLGLSETYQYLTVNSVTANKQRSFWYNPRFTRATVYINRTPYFS